jgi:hypothetical protein
MAFLAYRGGSPIMLLYIVARLYLNYAMLHAFHSMPRKVYEVVVWMKYIPHWI